MAKTNRIYYVLLSFLLLYSCSTKEKQEILTCTISKEDFSDIITIEGTVETVNSNQIVCPRVYNVSIGYIAEDGAHVTAGEVVCTLENNELVNSHNRLKKEQELLQAEYKKSKADLDLKYALLEAEIKNNETQTALSNLDSLQLLYSSDVQKKITALELEIAKVERVRFQHRVEVFDRINRSDLKKIELQLKQNEFRIKDDEERMSQLTLKAPQDGLFLRSGSLNGTGKLKKGDQMYPGFPIAEIPDISAMRVKLTASESEYKNIHLGDSVVLRFDAMPGNRAFGRITYKAPIGYPIKRDSKVKGYDLVATIEKKDINPDVGLSANCEIYTSHLKDTLTVPIISVFEEDSLKYVYVKSNKKYEKREVYINENSAEKAVILAGLSSGEIVTLMKPPIKMVGKTVPLASQEKEKIKKLIALKQSQLKPMQNGAPPRSTSGGNHYVIIMY